MLDRKPRPAAIVGGDCRVTLDRPVHHHDRNALDACRGSGPVAGQQQNAVDLASREGFDVFRLGRRVLVRTDKQHAVA
jgi:hypothetical protein